MLGGKDRRDVHRAVVAAPRRRLQAAPRPLLPRRRLQAAPRPLLRTYPGETDAMDNVVPQAALGIAAVVDPSPANDAKRARFVAFARAHLLAPETGVMAFSVSGAGTFAEPRLGRRLEQPRHTTRRRRLRRRAVARPPAVVRPQRRAALCRAARAPARQGRRRRRRPGPGDLRAVAGGHEVRHRRRPPRRRRCSAGGSPPPSSAGTSWSWGGRRGYLLTPNVGDAILLATSTARRFDRRDVNRHIDRHVDVPVLGAEPEPPPASAVSP
ncbi:MAG: hypothetical protein FJ137_13545 [Deltaproteobacteria bacterium]|nr:hypothetical protein [Deltaproteobacteria bacterium]